MSKKTPADQDGERLRELEGRMKEVMDLLGKGVTRDGASEGLERARQARGEHKGNGKRAFHGEKKVPLTMSTKTNLDLAEALKLRIRVGGFALELEESLQRMAEEQVVLLERELKRARH